MPAADHRPQEKRQDAQRSLFAPEQLPEPPSPWELADDADVLAAEVVFNRPVDTVFHYRVPNELRGMLAAGQRVRAPFGRGDRLTVGYCVGVGSPPPSTVRLKAIDSLIDREPLLSTNMLELTRWIADRYLCAWGQVLETVVPAGVKKKAGTRVVTLFEAAPKVDADVVAALPAKQRDVMHVLRQATAPLRGEDLANAADCGTGPIAALRKKGLVRTVRLRAATAEHDTAPAVHEPDLVLNPDQQAALDAVLLCLRTKRHRTLLLHGVTGSGKTEVYIQAIREVVAYGRQAIVLVPEISLTPQTIRRFRSRFPEVAVLHSHLTDAERHWQWQRIAAGSVQVVVGARSAVFAPTPHLGLIIIDEEHETSFKQDSTPRYHAREVARRRAEMEQVPLLLGTATPTLESYLRCRNRQDVMIEMPRRVEGLPLPPVVVVDTRNDPHIARGMSVGRALRTAIQTTLADNGQVILFLNLRGYSPTVWCRNCGEGIKCPDCDISLTFHRDRRIVRCHFCDFESTPPERCTRCGQPGLRYLGTGTQRLEEEVKIRFPEARCLRMDSDSMKKPGSHDEALESFRRGEVEILLGTQMIAKGLDFPNVTLVGVVDADTMLHQPDLRASERTFQLIAQVAGRTGRSSRGGRVLVQSSSPTEPAIQRAAQHDFQGFAERELAHRKELGAPPYSHLTRVIIRGEVENVVAQRSREMAEVIRAIAAEEQLPVRILGPAPAPVARLKKHFRFHFQLSAENLDDIARLWRRAAREMPQQNDVEYAVDVDAVNLR